MRSNLCTALKKLTNKTKNVLRQKKKGVVGGRKKVNEQNKKFTRPKKKGGEEKKLTNKQKQTKNTQKSELLFQQQCGTKSQRQCPNSGVLRTEELSSETIRPVTVNL